MNQLLRAAATACAAMVVWHLATATIVAALDIPYRTATLAELGIFLIILAAGYLGTRAMGRAWMGVVAALAAGLAHGTIGWRITDAIRGGGLPGGEDHPGARLGFMIEWLWLALILGQAGTAAAWLRARLRSRRAPRG